MTGVEDLASKRVTLCILGDSAYPAVLWLLKRCNALGNNVRLNILNDSFDLAEPVLAVPEKLKQYYAVTPTKLKLAALATFLVRLRNQKAVVFAPTQDVVEFLYSLFENMFDRLITKITTPTADGIAPKARLFRLHGEMSQSERSDVFRRFSQAERGFLFSTDVAARGLDLPSITWIFQFQAPETPAVYVHRIGRTARAGRGGSSVLLLIPNENSYVKMMRQDYGLNMRSIKFSSVIAGLDKRKSVKSDELRLVFEVQHFLDETVENDQTLTEMARKAYISFIRAYATYRNEQREIFNVRNGLHFGHVARSFCLKNEAPTKINEILRRNNAKPRPMKENDGHSKPNDANTSTSSYPMWQGSTFSKQTSGYKVDGSSLTRPLEKSSRGTRVISGKRAGGGRNGYQVAMHRFSEFASGL